MRLHIHFLPFKGAASGYSVDLEDFDVSYPRQHTMVLRRKKMDDDFFGMHEYILIGFSKDVVWHFNGYSEEPILPEDIDEGNDWEPIQSIEFKTEY